MAKAVKALNALEDEAASYFACAVAADQSSGLAGRTDGALRLLINDAFLMTDDPTVLANEKQKTERQARAASSAMAFSHQKTLNAIRRDDDLGSEPFNPRFNAVDWLIVDILRLVAIVQADLSVNDSYPDKGSLPKFYQALRPCLPPGFPETHRLSRLRRLKEMFSHGKI
jgi:hypothetical protein